MNQETYNLLYANLNERSGILQPYNSSEAVFQIDWPRNITFIVRENHKQGWFCVERNQQEVSVIFRYYKTPNKKTIGMMQSLIDEAESGKYNNKKTLSDRIQDVVQQRKLTSYMNNTKWREMLDDFIEIPQLSIMYKTLFDEINPEFFWSVIDDEYLAHMNMAVIEWFKIEDVIREYRKRGLLLDTEVYEENVKDKIEEILEKHHIYFEYEKDSGVFIVYGYR